DTFASRNYMLENYDFIDSERVGIMGWSHGGLHTLMNIFDHPNAYKVAYAGVPVSDLVARMGYKTQGYRDLYSADYHIGKTAYENQQNISQDRKSTRLNSSHVSISYAVFCLKKKKKRQNKYCIMRQR